MSTKPRGALMREAIKAYECQAQGSSVGKGGRRGEHMHAELRAHLRPALTATGGYRPVHALDEPQSWFGSCCGASAGLDRGAADEARSGRSR